MTATTKKPMIKNGLKPITETEDEAHKFFNLQRIITVTRIQQDKIYNNFKGSYTSLTPEEKKRIATCLMGPVKDMFRRLGMNVSFTRLSDES